MKKLCLIITIVVFCLTSTVWAEQKSDYPVTPVKFTGVHVSDCFWRPRLDAARDVTIPDCFKKCEPTRIPNFARAAGMEQDPFKGIYFDDSDVYKIIEGASYVLALEKNEKLDKYVDSVIEKIAGAQEEDGYLYTARTWKAGDSFTVNFPMQTLKVVTDERVKADVGQACIQRGSLVYCIEAQDCVVKETGKAPSSLHALVLADDAPLTPEFQPDLLNGVMTVKGTLKECVRDGNGSVTTRDVDCVAIPYYSWANRGVSPMSVYFPRTVDAAAPVAAPKD